MPAIYVYHFAAKNAEGTTQSSSTAYAWKWADGDADADLVAFMEAHSFDSAGDFSVDRSGPRPKLVWQAYVSQWPDGYAPTGTYSEIEFAAGDVIQARHAGSQWAELPGINPMIGCWESDEFGRPFDLNALLAPPPAP